MVARTLSNKDKFMHLYAALRLSIYNADFLQLVLLFGFITDWFYSETVEATWKKSHPF